MNASGMMMEPQEAKVEAPFRETVSRLFIFRGLWAFVMAWPMIPWGIWIYIVYILQFFHMLILGQRHQGLWQSQLRYFRHVTKWQAYFMWLTDKRPKFIED